MVAHVKQHHATGARCHIGTHDGDVGGELHQPARIARRECDIRDDGIALVHRIERKMRAAFDQFIRARAAEAAAAEQIGRACDLHAHHFCVCGIRKHHD